MVTAILVFVMIVITIAVFFLGIYIGARLTAGKSLEYIQKALDESSLSTDEKIKFLNKLAESMMKN